MVEVLAEQDRVLSVCSLHLLLKAANRAGSGHYFSGPGRVSGLWFWPGSGSGYWKSTTG